MVPINASPNYHTGLPVLGQHFMCVLRLAFPHDHGSGRSDCNFEVGIFVVDGSVYYPVNDPVTRLQFRPDNCQRQVTTFDRKGARSRAQEQHQRKQDPARHQTGNSISSWLRAAGVAGRSKLIGKGRRFVSGALWLRPRTARRVRSEGINQVKLQAVEPRFLCTGPRNQHARSRCRGNLHPGSQSGVLEVRIQSAAVPPGERRSGTGSNPPQTVDTVLQNVGGSALIAFSPGRNHRVLLIAEPRVSDLNVALLFLLADTDVSQVSVRLLAQVLSGGCLRGALSQELVIESRTAVRVGVVERVRGGVQVVLVFDQQVDGQPRPRSLELIVQNQVGVEKVREEVKTSDIASGVDGDVGRVRHAIWPKSAGGKCGGGKRSVKQTRTLRRTAPGTFRIDRDTRGRGSRRDDDARIQRACLESAGIQKRILIAEVEDRE